ncbi:MAG: hypothetical protein IKW51_08630 [Bacteroidales bacterium]|nr:hypothetical protein [Bacteroidales bacterium]
MDFVSKKYKAYECFANFINGINTEEYQQFSDLFLPMSFKENCHNIFINVGIKSSKSFTSWLSTKLESFIVVLNVFNEEPQLIIRGNTGINIMMINLALITKLHIKTTDNPNSCYYDIEFRYNNEVDYQMRIVINK